MIYQDAIFSRGVALIDPHGNLADDVLSYLGSSGFFKITGNLERLVYINLSGLDFSPEINLLELQKDEDPRNTPTILSKLLTMLTLLRKSKGLGIETKDGV